MNDLIGNMVKIQLERIATALESLVEMNKPQIAVDPTIRPCYPNIGYWCPECTAEEGRQHHPTCKHYDCETQPIVKRP